MNAPIPDPAAERPGFEEPWHATLAALGQLLARDGVIEASALSEALGEKRSVDRSHDGAVAYHDAALAALMELLDREAVVPEDELAAMEAAWREAYLTTPHGQPVTLGPDAMT